MFASRTRNPAYTDDDPRIVLALRAATEPPARGWNFFLKGCAVECIFLTLAVVAESGFGEMPPRHSEQARKPPMPLYIPPRARPRTPAPPPPPATHAAIHRVPVVLQYPAVQPTKVRVDMSSIEISVMDDVANEIPAVVRQHNGQLALLEVDDPAYARYTFAPPDWQMQDGIVDVRRRVRFAMSPPSQWPLLQSLATNNGIKLDRYQVSALFDGAFQDCLEREIRSHATAPSGSGRVSAVVLVFNSSRSCGIDVVNVQFAPVH